ncbi:hypothetical protein QJS10_CPB20g00693 [Acorus calamus]|uniref:Reverse transcriptase zinc-binding domain-containing protein n=1 Tax=Acorus calamus TaxID=4465 RepID=A0AAV9CBW0_ACOCL|nr:hypothetical protein QJS10_CPB20g00693 [Acorus calamus]
MTHVAKGIFGLASEFGQTIVWAVEDGHTTKFWEDIWSGSAPLQAWIPLVFQVATRKEGVVARFWEATDTGNEDRMSYCVPYRELRFGRETQTAPDKGFTVSMAYDWWSREQFTHGVTQEKAATVWKMRISLKIKGFLWLVLQERLLTKAYRAHWRPNDPDKCELCLVEREITEHLLSTCSMSRQIWQRLYVEAGLQGPISNIEELWQAGIRLQRANGEGITARVALMILPTATWAIWRTRNAKLFKGQPSMSRTYGRSSWDWCRHGVGDSWVPNQ